MLLDEGDMFNTQLWDFSILRLNQLGYFEMLKKEDAADIKRNPQSNTVDITLKVKERGKNSIGLERRRLGHRGQLRGLQLFHQQLPRAWARRFRSIRSSARACSDVSLGFTEPYFLDRPLQLGFDGLPAALQFRPGPRGLHSGRRRT